MTTSAYCAGGALNSCRTELTPVMLRADSWCQWNLATGRFCKTSQEWQHAAVPAQHWRPDQGLEETHTFDEAIFAVLHSLRCAALKIYSMQPANWLASVRRQCTHGLYKSYALVGSRQSVKSHTVPCTALSQLVQGQLSRW